MITMAVTYAAEPHTGEKRIFWEGFALPDPPTEQERGETRVSPRCYPQHPTLV
jgi:hypothetical protein